MATNIDTMAVDLQKIEKERDGNSFIWKYFLARASCSISAKISEQFFSLHFDALNVQGRQYAGWTLAACQSRSWVCVSIKEKLWVKEEYFTAM